MRTPLKKEKTDTALPPSLRPHSSHVQEGRPALAHLVLPVAQLQLHRPQRCGCGVVLVLEEMPEPRQVSLPTELECVGARRFRFLPPVLGLLLFVRYMYLFCLFVCGFRGWRSVPRTSLHQIDHHRISQDWVVKHCTACISQIGTSYQITSHRTSLQHRTTPHHNHGGSVARRQTRSFR